LNVVPLTVPPLRQRPEDIPLLVAYFVARFAKRFGRKFDGVSRSTMDTLVAYPWNGNIRELQNIIERAVVLSNAPMLTIDPDMLAIVEEPRRQTNAAAMPDANATESGAASFLSLEDAERQHIARVLQQTRGVVEGPAGAAKILNLNPNTLRSRMKKLGVTRPAREIS
jgi:formate hydrogenlyase transcriptional activator